MAAMRDRLHRSRDPRLPVILVSLKFIYPWPILLDLGGASNMTALLFSDENGRSQTHVANIHNFLIKGVSSCSSPPGLAPSGIERPE